MDYSITMFLLRQMKTLLFLWSVQRNKKTNLLENHSPNKQSRRRSKRQKENVSTLYKLVQFIGTCEYTGHGRKMACILFVTAVTEQHEQS